MINKMHHIKFRMKENPEGGNKTEENDETSNCIELARERKDDWNKNEMLCKNLQINVNNV